MAEVSVTASRKGLWLTFEWTGVTENDTFEEIYLSHNVSDTFIEVDGTFGGATLTLNGWVDVEGSAEGVVNPAGSAVSLTAAGGSPVRDVWPFLRPVHTGGTSESINVRIYSKVVK